MRKKILCYSILQIIFFCGFAQISVSSLLTNNLNNPIGIDNASPRFSWQMLTEKRNSVQTAYEIKITSRKKSIWSSGKINSDQSVMLTYQGKPLQSGTTYCWQVRIWDNNGQQSAWSDEACFQTTLLHPEDWKAKWIEANFIEDSINRPAIYFRKSFVISKKIASATAYITAHGMYEAQINGKKMGDAFFTPGWTSYNKRLQYQVYDITNSLVAGQNAIGTTVGNGWYRGSLAWEKNRNIYGKKLGLLCQIHIEYKDGTEQDIVTDETWKSSTGSIQFAEIYHGETIDARAEKTGWSTNHFNDAAWNGVSIIEGKMDLLTITENEPVRKHETFKPIKVIVTPSGEKVLDFGQNLVGWVVVKAAGKAGNTISIKHAEVLDKAGNFYTENLRAAKATATYILSGNGEEVFEPHFTFYGFRYIKIEGYPGEINPDNFTAVALYSDMKPTGTFTTSNPLLNQLQHNIQWGQRGNFVDVPTDCPQRDERLGWTGDAQAFSRTAAFNFGVYNFFTKWLKDLSADQLPNGAVPHVIPNVLGVGNVAATGWADVSTIIPWNMYLAYGDKTILETQYPSMKAWVGYMENASKNHLWNTGSHFGDWLFYRPFDDNDGKSAVTDKYLLAQCFFANSVQIMINTGKLLDKKEDVAHYTQLLQQLKDAFLQEYVTPNGRLVSGTQTAYVIALNFDMFPESMRAKAAATLVENIKSYGNHLTTGFLGTPYLCHVLTRFGYTDVAFKLLMQETYPSWLYPVKMGATTIWERWNGIRPDKTFEPASMNSFNHYAYGAIGDWMYRILAGLDTDIEGPGYKKIIIKPYIGGKITQASASLDTYYGKLSSGWTIENNKFILAIEIPANTSATVFIPAKNVASISENGVSIGTIPAYQQSTVADGYVKVSIGSGKYHFEVNQ
jgi:alpha-L-rhamnosidase